MVDDARLTAASGLGVLLAGAARVLALRPSAKPLHPRGTTWSAVLVRHGGSKTGVAWIDEPGTDTAVLRRSRAVGLPGGWPDIHGLAIRTETADGGLVDVLLATTGSGPIGRFMLHAGRRPESMFFGSLLPYRSAAGPIVLGAALRDDESWDLRWAVGRAPWTSFARLAPWERIPDTDMSFDPVLNRPDGLEQYDALARLRLPAYRTARRTRGDSITTPVTGTRIR
jgi:hypothetical protein